MCFFSSIDCTNKLQDTFTEYIFAHCINAAVVQIQLAAEML